MRLDSDEPTGPMCARTSLPGGVMSITTVPAPPTNLGPSMTLGGGGARLHQLELRVLAGATVVLLCMGLPRDFRKRGDDGCASRAGRPIRAQVGTICKSSSARRAARARGDGRSEFLLDFGCSRRGCTNCTGS